MRLPCGLVGYLAWFMLLTAPVSAQTTAQDLAKAINGEDRIQVRTVGYTALLWVPQISAETLSFSQGELVEGYALEDGLPSSLHMSELVEVRVQRKRPWLGAALGVVGGLVIGRWLVNVLVESNNEAVLDCRSHAIRLDLPFSACGEFVDASSYPEVVPISAGVGGGIGLWIGGTKWKRWKIVYRK